MDIKEGLLYTTRQAAHIAGISQARVRQYCRYSNVEKYGRDYLIGRDTINALIARKHKAQ